MTLPELADWVDPSPIECQGGGEGMVLVAILGLAIVALALSIAIYRLTT